jgi:hypothetical protein
MKKAKLIPILFSTPMVRALLEGRKTQTRRINFKCEVGDVLWVRETWAPDCEWNENPYRYKADYFGNTVTKWKPNIFMPRLACRLFLHVKDMRRERLQDISEADAYAEGIIFKKVESTSNREIWHQNYIGQCLDNIGAIESYRTLWDSINAKRGYSWESNPMVDVIELKRIENYGGPK